MGFELQQKVLFKHCDPAGIVFDLFQSFSRSAAKGVVLLNQVQQGFVPAMRGCAAL